MKIKVSLMVIVGLLAMVLLLESNPVHGGKVRGVTNDTIKLGYILDMTGPGAVLCVPMSKGFRDYFKYVNDKGGINGRKVRLIGEDDRLTIPMAIAAFKKLVFRDKVLAIYGVSNSGAIMALLSQVAKEKIPIITIPPTPAVVNPTRRYWFNTTGTYEDEVNIVFDYIMKDSKAKGITPKIGFVCAQIEYGKIGLRVAKKRAQQYNTKLVDVEYVPMGSLEAASQVLRLKMKGANYVIIHHITNEAAVVLRDSVKLRYRTNFVVGLYGWNEDLIKMVGKAAENALGIHAFSSWYDDSPGMADLRRITLKLHPGTEDPMRPKTFVQGWVGALIYAEAIKRAGKDLNGESLVNALETFKNFSTGGLCGPITYTPDSHKAQEYYKFFKPDLASNRLIATTDWKKPINMK